MIIIMQSSTHLPNIRQQLRRFQNVVSGLIFDFHPKFFTYFGVHQMHLARYTGDTRFQSCSERISRRNSFQNLYFNRFYQPHLISPGSILHLPCDCFEQTQYIIDSTREEKFPGEAQNSSEYLSVIFQLVFTQFSKETFFNILIC